jgi:hypothetical protein
MNELEFDSDGLQGAQRLITRYVYEVMGARHGGWQMTSRQLSAQEAIDEYGYQFPDVKDAVIRRRLWVEDLDCKQDSAFCPCGPVGEWEIVGPVPQGD